MTRPVPFQIRGPQSMLYSQSEALLRANIAVSGTLQEPPTIAVVGAVSQGKSSVINALLGEDILPVGPVPTTRRLCRIRHGPSPGAALTFEGTAVSVSLDELTLHIADPRADTLLEIESPVERLRRWSFVDVPGLGGPVSSEMTKASASALEGSGALLLVTSVQRPVGAAETQLLHVGSKAQVRAACVVTHGDLLEDENDAERIVDFHREHLNGLGFGWVDVILFPTDVITMWNAIDRLETAARLRTRYVSLRKDLGLRFGDLSKTMESSLALLDARRAERATLEAEREKLEGMKRYMEAYVDDMVHRIRSRIEPVVAELNARIQPTPTLPFNFIYSVHNVSDIKATIIADLKTRIDTAVADALVGLDSVIFDEFADFGLAAHKAEVLMAKQPTQLGRRRSVAWNKILSAVPSALSRISEMRERPGFFWSDAPDDFRRWFKSELKVIWSSVEAPLPAKLLYAGYGALATDLKKDIADHFSSDLDASYGSVSAARDKEVDAHRKLDLLRQLRDGEIAKSEQLMNVFQTVTEAGWFLGTGSVRASLWRLRVLHKRGLLDHEGTAMHAVLEGILRLGADERAWLLKNQSADQTADYLAPFLAHPLGAK